MHHIKLKVPSFAPFVTGIIDNIKMTVHKYHNVWVSHRMNYEPRKLMDVRHSCGLVFDNDIGVVVGFKSGSRLFREPTREGFRHGVIKHTVFSPVMSLRDWLTRFITDENQKTELEIKEFLYDTLYCKRMNFQYWFGNGHVIRPVKHCLDMSYMPYVHRRSSYQYFSHLTIKTIVTDDTTVTFKPCR